MNELINACLTFYYSKSKIIQKILLYGDLLWCKACQGPDLYHPLESRHCNLDSRQTHCSSPDQRQGPGPKLNVGTNHECWRMFTVKELIKSKTLPKIRKLVKHEIYWKCTKLKLLILLIEYPLWVAEKWWPILERGSKFSLLPQNRG